jgi:50S ribosomal protein L16 3-hydroxylase
MTVSMGFRAPAVRSLLTAFCEHVVQTRVAEKQLVKDPISDLLNPQNSPAFISLAARREIQSILKNQLTAALDNDDFFDKWLGSYLTIPLR